MTVKLDAVIFSEKQVSLKTSLNFRADKKIRQVHEINRREN